MPKHIAAAAMEGTTKRRWYKTQRDENEGDLNIMGIKKQAGNGQKLLGMEEDYWNSRSTTDCSTLDEQEDHQMNEATISKPEWILKILQICNSFVS